MTPAPQELQLSLIVPAYQEAHRILDSLSSIGRVLEGHEISCEVIVVVDGATDETESIARAFANAGEFSTHFEVLTLPVNSGKGAAVKQGVGHASGEVIAFTDADLPFGMEAVLDACRLLLNQPELDLVVGDRNDPRSKAREVPPLARRIAGKVYSWLVASVIRSGLTDTQCGLKLFRREAAKSIFARSTLPGFGFDVELIHIAQRAGMTIRTVPVALLQHEGSRVRLVGDSLVMFADLFRIRRNSARGLYEITPSKADGS